MWGTINAGFGRREDAMRRSAVVMLGVALALALGLQPARAAKVRPAMVAGSFYPGDAAELAKTVDGLLARPAQADGARVAVLVAPHAGYQYSGAVAGEAFATVKGRSYKRVVVLAPSHLESFPFAAIYDGDAYTTPLGTLAVDKEFAARLAKASPLVKMSEAGHREVQGSGEHALEDELPFLQRALKGEFKIVPIIVGEQNYELSRALGVALAKTADAETLIVVSSDLSHFHTYDDAAARDRSLLQAVGEGDFLAVEHNLRAGTWEACGGGPLLAAMMAADRMGADDIRVLKYLNSGDVTGDKQSVVGYGAVAFLRGTAAAKAGNYDLDGTEKAALLAIARASVEKSVRERRAFEPDRPGSPRLAEERGAFVTLTKKGELRGCIGYVSPLKPLYLTVRDVASYAALRDSRFPPVKGDELGALEYEVSVLSPFQRVHSVDEIQLGTHGVLLRRGNRESVFLPQVATEQHWDRTTMLNELALKAGLPEDAWRDPASDLFVFTAVVFSEEQAAGHGKKAGAER